MESNHLFSKDIFQYIGNIADDKTVLQLIFLNREKYGEDYIKKVLEIRYPYLLKFKKENESYRQFYSKNISYMKKLKEEYSFDYIKYCINSPQHVYNTIKAYNIFIELSDPLGGSNNTLNIKTKGYLYELTKFFNNANYVEEYYDFKKEKIISYQLLNKEVLLSRIFNLLENDEIQGIIVYKNCNVLFHLT
jgi:hypothetical protein